MNRLSARWLPAAGRPPEMCGLRTRPRTEDVDPSQVELPSARGAYRLAAPGTITRISLFRPKHGSRSMNIQQQQTSKQKRENLTTRAQEFNKFSVKCFCTFCHRSLGISNTKHCWQHLTFCRCQHPQYAM